jgi:hypothetical protein
VTNDQSFKSFKLSVSIGNFASIWYSKGTFLYFALVDGLDSHFKNRVFGKTHHFSCQCSDNILLALLQVDVAIIKEPFQAR